jgi:hypothetical protein
MQDDARNPKQCGEISLAERGKTERNTIIEQAIAEHKPVRVYAMFSSITATTS